MATKNPAEIEVLVYRMLIVFARVKAWEVSAKVSNKWRKKKKRKKRNR